LHSPPVRLNGSVFVAVRGSVNDGHHFIGQAVEKGAAYIVCEQHKADLADYAGEIIVVDDSARAAAQLAQAAAGNPASRLTNLAVTGTNGKTTVAFLVRACIQQAGHKCALIGTVLYDTGQVCAPACLTTPDSFALAEMQAQMVKAGCKYMIIEASSHALSQKRLAGINFKAAAFTNLAGDHMDYHKTKDDYLAAKAALFESLPPGAAAVLNKMSPEAAKIARRIRTRRNRIIWYDLDSPADITGRIDQMDVTGTTFTLKYENHSAKVKTPLLGRYNVSNHLAAAGLCLAAGLELDTIAAGLSALKTIPGRLEKVDFNPPPPFDVVIDYAHTDDALSKVLSALKPLCAGRLIVVFGCGGDRDRTKRPRMARVAESLADFVVVTSDNPRTEKPQNIIEDILKGFHKLDPSRITVETDRTKAIELAVQNAGENDIVIIAGKGHETYQIIGNERIEFSDKAVAQQCLHRLKQTSFHSQRSLA